MAIIWCFGVVLVQQHVSHMIVDITIDWAILVFVVGCVDVSLVVIYNSRLFVIG